MIGCMCVLLFVVVILNSHLELWYPLKAELQVRTIVLTIYGRYYILSIPNLISMQFLD